MPMKKKEDFEQNIMEYRQESEEPRQQEFEQELPELIQSNVPNDIPMDSKVCFANETSL